MKLPWVSQDVYDQAAQDEKDAKMKEELKSQYEAASKGGSTYNVLSTNEEYE